MKVARRWPLISSPAGSEEYGNRLAAYSLRLAPATYAAVVALVGFAALAAEAYIPARRAAKGDSMVALRPE
jgi:hypothetical protein